MSTWRDCIVVLMDLTGVKKRAFEGNASATSLMRSFHQLVHREMAAGLRELDHAYVWNDSVLLLARVDEPRAYARVMHAADDLKRRVDTVAPSYAIAVKGRAFPGAIQGARVTVIKASSFAMANCFEIESEAKRKELRKAWYVDVRIARRVPEARGTQWCSVKLLPSGKHRRIYTHDRYLWGANDEGRTGSTAQNLGRRSAP